MKSKYELTISTDYVPNWTYVEAIRELFQNAHDSEIIDSNNKMSFSYNNETITITNKTSTLEISSLLLGSTSKATDNRTIGKHGEGYKVAFMVLLREGKKIKVYNRNKNQTWTARLVKSRRFETLVPVIEVENTVFKRIKGSNSLEIEVSGITDNEYNDIKDKNLYLKDNVEKITFNDNDILLSEEEKGNIYVGGLYICNNEEFLKGYNFSPSDVNLNRDRRILSSFNISWLSASLWLQAYKYDEYKSLILKMVKEGAPDISYIVEKICSDEPNKLHEEIATDLAEDFRRTEGEKAVAVVTTEELETTLKLGYKPKLVTKPAYYLMQLSDTKNSVIVKRETLKSKFTKFKDKISNKLDTNELIELVDLISRISN